MRESSFSSEITDEKLNDESFLGIVAFLGLV
jgi:hypothetical protein